MKLDVLVAWYIKRNSLDGVVRVGIWLVVVEPMVVE